MSRPASTPLTFTIAKSTPHSGKYVPENILVDKPQDQSSRWSGAFQGGAKQWMLLRLEPLAVLKSITFGKFSKQHPCNMKEFKVFVGMTEDKMTEVLHSGLKNDATPETFAIKHTDSAGVAFTSQYVKIVPICAHGQSFHVSIWHVSMSGITDPPVVERIQVNYAEHRETSVLRRILKHLRQRRLLTPFHSILSRTNLHLEHPLITQLHSIIVLKGDWSRSEDLLSSMSSAGLFENYINTCQPHAIWTRLVGTDADGDVPPARGGHAMCMDPVNEMIYLFGGWDGEKSLDDFWVYNVREDKWRVLSHSTSGEQNAPGARSCHKMVFDTKTGSIYLLGRLDDSDGLRASVTVAPVTVPHAHAQSVPAAGAAPQQQQRQPTVVNAGEATGAGKTYCSEFYRYHTRGADKGKWDFLSFDTLSSGGPPLLFDHQMVIDCETQIMYVFGGRVVDGDWDTFKYSGLYSYNVRLSKWRLLQQSDNTGGSQIIIPSRFGHSMVLEPTSKTLFIFAGQRDERYLSDMYAYNITTNTASELFSNFTAAGGPDACFTQRAVIDPALKEMYVFCGLTRNSASGIQNTTLRSYLSNWVYRYDNHPGKWAQIMRHPETTASEIPMPRFAHQVVYNPATRSVFLHGGNAGGLSAAVRGNGSAGGNADGDGGDGGDGDGKEKEKEKRLDDFWRMELRRPGPEEIVRQAKFLIRRQQFREMCENSAPVEALQFLQTEVSSVVDHKNAKETELFRSLLTHLLSLPPPPEPTTTEATAPPKMVRTPSDSSESTGSESTTTSLREGSTRPRKRSRGSGNWGWTNELGLEDGGEAGSPEVEVEVSRSSDLRAGGVRRRSLQALRGVPDPIEGPAGEKLSAERYAQRTEVFEGLLEFVGEGEGEKQLLEGLLEFVERESGGGAGGLGLGLGVVR